jgi:hypothetical protein
MLNTLAESMLVPGVKPVPRRRPSCAMTTFELAETAPGSAAASDLVALFARKRAAPARVFFRKSRLLAIYIPVTEFFSARGLSWRPVWLDGEV